MCVEKEGLKKIQWLYIELTKNNNGDAPSRDPRQVLGKKSPPHIERRNGKHWLNDPRKTWTDESSNVCTVFALALILSSHGVLIMGLVLLALSAHLVFWYSLTTKDNQSSALTWRMEYPIYEESSMQNLDPLAQQCILQADRMERSRCHWSRTFKKGTKLCDHHCVNLSLQESLHYKISYGTYYQLQKYEYQWRKR